MQNQFGFSANIELPNKDDCNIILYDKYGNQLGRAEKISDTQRKLSVPNWDVNCSDYAIKIFNKQGEELKNIPYKLSFKVENNPDHEKTDLLCVTYSKLRQQYAKNDPDYMNTVNYYNELCKQAEENYKIEVDKLHAAQFEALPDELKYKGNSTVNELLERQCQGEDLTAQEQEYVNIYGNLSDIQKAEAGYRLKRNISEKFSQELAEEGVNNEDIEGTDIAIDSCGQVAVSPNLSSSVKDTVVNKLQDFKDDLYRCYIAMADSLRSLPPFIYQYALEVQETKRFLYKATRGKTELTDLYFKNNGDIGGLPPELDKFINKTTDNMRADELRELFSHVISNINEFGKDNIPEFKASFTIKNRKFDVIDAGISDNVNNIISQLNEYASHSIFSKLYNYQFHKVF